MRVTSWFWYSIVLSIRFCFDLFNCVGGYRVLLLVLHSLSLVKMWELRWALIIAVTFHTSRSECCVFGVRNQPLKLLFLLTGPELLVFLFNVWGLWVLRVLLPQTWAPLLLTVFLLFRYKERELLGV